MKNEVTQLLNAAGEGDPQAAGELLSLVYDELRRVAASKMARESPGQTLQPTALVHEAYLRVAGDPDSRWAGRPHFFHAAARAMRDILVEQFRRKSSLKRGGGHRKIAVEHAEIAIESPSEDLLALEEALQRLEREQPDQAEIVMLRYFAGLSAQETADVLGVSLSSVERKWRFIRAWLRREVSAQQEP